ncbi:hypothetical protein [Streptomyces sp. NPDC101455]|uniref:hypothetical protein n=1 Tax=Streptomyces sp. NPDC101455 TaxID=3366142 RepID=UPI0038214B23
MRRASTRNASPVVGDVPYEGLLYGGVVHRLEEVAPAVDLRAKAHLPHLQLPGDPQMDTASSLSLSATAIAARAIRPRVNGRGFGCACSPTTAHPHPAQRPRFH